MNDHILFVHVPKTAGTSFRYAAESYYDKEEILRDYASISPITSYDVMEIIYNERDKYKFYQKIQQLPRSFLSGHYPVGKYMSLYRTEDIVSIIREPVSQVLSHYVHHVSNYGYKKELREFIKDHRFKNIQSRLLAGRNLGMYGFIGLTEEYEETISLFNKYFDVDFKVFRENPAKKPVSSISELDEEMILEIKSHTDKDMALYDAARRQFQCRKELAEKGQKFTYGFIQEKNKEKIRGCAFQRGSEDPVEIDLFAGEKLIDTKVAKDYRPGLLTYGLPRKGFVGFEFNLNKNSMDMDELRCLVRSTSQEIRL